MVLENQKNIVVRKETWMRVGCYKRFPDKSTFDAVLNWLVDEHEENEHTKELLK